MIAGEIGKILKSEIQSLTRPPRLDVILAGNDPASLAYVKRKQAFGEMLGVRVIIHTPDVGLLESGREIAAWVASIAENSETDGVLVQLPLSESVRRYTRDILDAIPVEKDVDALSSRAIGRFVAGTASVPPTVVAVMDHIFTRHKIGLRRARIALVGAGGELVGKPIAMWLLAQDIPFYAITKDTAPEVAREIIGSADIVISGVGKAGLLTPEMVKKGVIAIDAGTSGSSGSLRGDMDPAIAEKAELFTPVPGGVGPITVAMLFRNLVELMKLKK